MALVVGSGFLVQPCSSSFICKNIYKPLSGVTNTFWPTRPGTTRCLTRTAVRAQLRPTWLPGLDPPPYLDGRWAFHLIVHVNVHLCCFKKENFAFELEACLNCILFSNLVCLEILVLIHLGLERIQKAWSGMCRQSWFILALLCLELLEFFLLMWVVPKFPWPLTICESQCVLAI